uniref:Uncharacterized protein n=1 Tax=Oryza nivara TaxID=4536 RepID=A0A0E0HIU3_ORYNI
MASSAPTAAKPARNTEEKAFRPQFNAEEAVEYQLEALKYNDQPRQDYGIEVMYRFAGFDPFERSTYFGRQFDLGQNLYKQRVWVRGSRPEEEAIFQFTMVQRVGGSWDGYWLTESLINDDGDALSGDEVTIIVRASVSRVVYRRTGDAMHPYTSTLYTH